MQALELQTQLIEEIKQIPSDKLAEIYDLIHYFRLGLNQSKQAQIIETKPQNSFFETYINNPIKLSQFTALNRDDIYER
jgi:hypothetical protein